jgi:hypothetical protein
MGLVYRFPVRAITVKKPVMIERIVPIGAAYRLK